MILSLYIGNDKLDLFQDESIEINTSIANVNDITKNTTDYTKSFTVPATANNNRIFKHYYDANVDNTFDARVRQEGRIELDGFPFRNGNWQLEKVIVKKNNPSSYSLNFVGNLFSLKDKVGQDELSDLDLTQYDHIVESNFIKDKLQNSGDMIYNLLTKFRCYYDSAGAPVNNDFNVNLATSGIYYDRMRPSIRLIKIIEAIESKYQINFSRDFFGRSEFQNLYLWINNDAEIVSQRVNTVRMDFTNYGNVNQSRYLLDLINDTITIKSYPEGIRTTITPSPGYENVTYNLERRLNGESWGTEFSLTGTKISAWGADLDNNKHSFHISSNNVFKFTSTIKFGDNSFATFPEQTISPIFEIKNNIPKIKVIDFLKGIFSMFKLVVNSDDNVNFYIDTLVNYYAQGKVYDLTRFVKTDSIDVQRADLLNEIKFKFKEPKTILNRQFQKNTGSYYGDEEAKLTDDGTANGKPINGSSLSVELPFEQVVYERLFPTNIQYGAIIDESSNRVSIEPHIFYNINVNLFDKRLGFLDAGGARSECTTLNIPSHSIDLQDPQYKMSFGVEYDEFTYVSNENNLYTNYWKDYIDSIYNIKRRNYKMSAILPLSTLLKLRLNDIIQIKGNYYRIDNYNVNLITRETTLNLITAFDKIIGGFNSNVTRLYADWTAQEQSVSIPNIGNSTVDVDDETWLSATIVGTNVFFNFTENTTGLTRITDTTITNLESGQTIIITATQYAKGVTFDSTDITFDNNLITFDNG